MKPTKNRTFCIGCKKTKMFFESQSKADNFIKFNSEEISSQSNKVPKRSYYCSFCCGWHVTSVIDEDRAKYDDERDNKLWKQIYSNTKQKLPANELGKQVETLLSEIDKLLEQLKKKLWNTELGKANELFKEATIKYAIIEEKIKGSHETFSAIEKRKLKIVSYQNILEQIEVFEVNEDACQKYLDEHSLPKQASIISHYFVNKMFLAEIQKLYESVERAFSKNDNDELKRLIGLISEKFKTSKCIGLSYKRKEYENRISFLINSDVSLKPSKRQIQEHKNTLSSIIGYLEKAYEAYYNSNFDECRNILKTAECLLPGTNDETELVLVTHIEKITQMLDNLD